MPQGSFEGHSLSIRHSESIELVTALVADIAQKIDARVIFIKGSTLEQQGLRADHVSSDIDALIYPADLGLMLQALASAGWHGTKGPDVIKHFPEVSPTLNHEFWGIPIDIHVSYPGLLMDPSAAFEILWAKSTSGEFANRMAPVPDRISSAIILALHSIRSTKAMGRHEREFDELVDIINTEWSNGDKQRLSDLARDLHATATLEPLFERIGLTSVSLLDSRERQMLLDWNRRVATGSAPTSSWLHQISLAPPGRRFFLLWRAFWPSEHDLRAARPEILPGLCASLAARWLRWKRGLASLTLMVKDRREDRSRR